MGWQGCYNGRKKRNPFNVLICIAGVVSAITLLMQMAHVINVNKFLFLAPYFIVSVGVALIMLFAAVVAVLNETFS